MKTGESQVGLVFCACWNDHISLKCQNAGHILLILVSFLFLAIILPYITMLAKKFFPAFLPFISDAGGYPPCSGIFAICLILAAFFGAITFTLVYATVNHRNVNNWKFIKLTNKVALVVVVISALGLIITAANPVGYTDVPNRFEWVTTVLFEHSIGACMALMFVGFYQYLMGAIWWYLPDASKADRYIKVFFIGLYTILLLLSLYPIPATLLEEIGPNPFDFAGMKKLTYDLPRVYSVSRLICSVCEYSLCIFSAINIGLVYKDMQRVSFRVVLRHKSCTAEAEETGPSIKLKTIS